MTLCFGTTKPDQSAERTSVKSANPLNLNFVLYCHWQYTHGVNVGHMKKLMKKHMFIYFIEIYRINDIMLF
jgi:hypothetical protein